MISIGALFFGRMQSVSNDNFGPLVAYLVPGATVLLGLRPYFPELEHWFAATPPDAPTLGGFLYLTVAALAAGMAVSAIRWATIDTIHAATGICPPNLDFSRLHGNVDGLALLIDIHYRHFLFYSNMQIASVIAYVSYRSYYGFAGMNPWFDLGLLVIEVVFFLASRDTLRRYYRRSEDLLGSKSVHR